MADSDLDIEAMLDAPLEKRNKEAVSYEERRARQAPRSVFWKVQNVSINRPRLGL